MTSPKKDAAKWTDEERYRIAKYQIEAYTLQAADYQKLLASLPGRDERQIRVSVCGNHLQGKSDSSAEIDGLLQDQYRRIVKPGLLSHYDTGTPSSPSTPSKKRKECKLE